MNYMHVIGLLLLAACGGMSEPQSDADTEQASAAPIVRNWCCADELSGTPILSCGNTTKGEHEHCYCSGIVGIDGTCTDNTPFAPGTLCTGALLVCW